MKIILTVGSEINGSPQSEHGSHEVISNNRKNIKMNGFIGIVNYTYFLAMIYTSHCKCIELLKM